MAKELITYGAENWGWKEWREIEGIKMKYVRWSMKLNRTTPWHTIRIDTGIAKIATDAAFRAMKFEEKLCRAKEDSLERMCWEQACRDEEEKWSRRDRQKSWNGKKELLESVGLSVREWNNIVREGTDRKQEIRTRLKEMYLEETEGDLKKSTYAREAKEIIGRVGRFYGKEVIRKSRNGLEILGRFRMGCESRANECWRKEEERKCRACNKGWEETIKHVLMECEITGKRDTDWKRQLNGDRASIGRLNEVIWKRRRLEVAGTGNLTSIAESP